MKEKRTFEGAQLSGCGFAGEIRSGALRIVESTHVCGSGCFREKKVQKQILKMPLVCFMKHITINKYKYCILFFE